MVFLANTEFPYNICAFYDSNSSSTVPTTKGVNLMNISTYFLPELLKRIQDDIILRKLGSGSLAAYVRGISKLCDYLKRSPVNATAEDLRLFQLHLVNIGTTGQTINITLGEAYQ